MVSILNNTCVPVFWSFFLFAAFIPGHLVHAEVHSHLDIYIRHTPRFGPRSHTRYTSTYALIKFQIQIMYIH